VPGAAPRAVPRSDRRGFEIVFDPRKRSSVSREASRDGVEFGENIKKTDDDSEFDTKKAKKKLRRCVESHDHAIRLKGRDHGGPFPRTDPGGREDRWTGSGDGGHERHRTGDPEKAMVSYLSRWAKSGQ
jgi:hypothetical protein